MNTEFYVNDFFIKKKLQRKKNILDSFARLVCAKGSPWCAFQNIDENDLDEFWNLDEKYLTLGTLKVTYDAKAVKNYIRKYISYNDEIWNSDFIHGMALGGHYMESNKCFPSLYWRNNPVIGEMIKNTPFGGKARGHGFSKIYRYNQKCFWTTPAFSMNHSQDSLSYLAGFFATGQIRVSGGKTYVMYHCQNKDFLKSLGVPIEKYVYQWKSPLISPVWPALFSLKMPSCVQNSCLKQKKAYNAHEYAAILWRSYAKSDFRRNGIPYLQGRRKIYYSFKCEEGAIERIEKLRVELGLVNLDKRFREMVQIWESRVNE